MILQRRKLPGRLIIAVVFIAGVILITQGSYIRIKAGVADWMIGASWQHREAGSPPTRPWPWADTAVVARLQVRRLNIEYLVMRDASGESLAFGPGVVVPGQLPGANGHSLIAGHRDTHFEFLSGLEIGDEILVDNYLGTETRYLVEATTIIDSREGHIAIDPDTAAVTLITCYPFNALVPGGPLRYLVHATAQRINPLLTPSYAEAQARVELLAAVAAPLSGS